MAEQKLSSLQQAYADRNRTLKNNEGATESSRAALSAVTGRSILKTKEETAKMRRNEEIAARVNAANIEGAAASGAVTMEKAKASAAAQLDRVKRNEVISILNMGVYDPSFPDILGFREDVVKNFADKKAREIEERKAIKKASENARQEYEQALEEIQNIKKVAGTWQGEEPHIETPKNTEEARSALDLAAKRAEDPMNVSEFGLLRQKITEPAIDLIWSKEGRSDGRSAARAAEAGAEPISEKKQKALQEEKLKQAEQRAAALKEAADKYEEILAKRIARKRENGLELTELEKQTAESPAGRIRIARQELARATADEREEAFSDYAGQLTGGIQEAALAASAAIEQITVKTERAEALSDAEKETLNDQRDQLQQMIRIIERELEKTDFSIEGQDLLVEQKEGLSLLLESVEAGIDYADNYAENKQELLYNYYDRIYGAYTVEELEAKIAEHEKQTESAAELQRKLVTTTEWKEGFNWKETDAAYVEAKEAEAEIRKIEAYIRQRKEREQNQPKIEQGQKLIMEAPGANYFEKFQYMMDITGEEAVKRGYYYTGEDIENENDIGEVLEKSYAEYSVRSGALDSRRDITMAYQANLRACAENLFTPAELERYSDSMAAKIKAALEDGSGGSEKGDLIRQIYKYSGGRNETFKGKYTGYYDDILDFKSGNYGNFTEEEGKRVLAIMDQYGYDAAFDYYAAAKEDALLRAADKLPGAAQVTLGILSGAEQFLKNGASMLSNALNPEGGYARIGGDLFTASHQLNMMGIENEALETLYMIGYSVVDMIPTIALSSVPYVGQAAGATYMFSKVLAQTYNESVAQGKRADEAFTYAVLNAAAETTMEKLMGGVESLASKNGLLKKLHSAVERLSATPGVKRAMRIFSSMGSEGMEEFLQEVADPFFRKLASDLTTMEESELDQIDWEEAAKSFIIGAGSAGILNGITGISNARNTGVKYTAAYESLLNGKATDDINTAAELGNKRAQEVLRAIQTKTPRYEGKEGIFAFASPQDMINIRQSIKRRGNRLVMESVKNSLNSIEGAKEKYKAGLLHSFKKILNGKSIDAREAADIINDQNAAAIFEQIAGTRITGMLPNEVAALARLEAFVDEHGTISKGRMNLFRDAFGKLDTRAINEIARYQDMVRTTDAIFEDEAVKANLNEEEQDAVAALRILTEETQIAFLVTDKHETGDYLAGNLVAIRPEDLNRGVFYNAAHRAYFITQQINPDAAAEIKEFILAETERIMTKEALAEEIKKIRRQLAVDGEDISIDTAKDELCARLLPSILLQGVNIEKLAAENEAAAVELRRVLAAVQNHLKDAIEQKRMDPGLKNFAESVMKMQDKDAVKKRKYKIGDIDKQHAELLAKIIERETGKKCDFSNYEVWISGNTIRHIEERHGKNGAADHSMSREEDIAMIPWVLDRATDGEILRKRNGKPDLDYEYRNADQSPSPKVLLRRKISDETFFIAECVPDNAAKRIYVKSAYKNKTDRKSAQNGAASSAGSSGTARALRMEPKDPLQVTSETLNGYSPTTEHSIADDSGGVNGNFYRQDSGSLTEGESAVVYDKKESEPQSTSRAAYVPTSINGSLNSSGATAAEPSITDDSGVVNSDFYELVFHGLTEDTDHVYKRMTQAIKERRAEEKGFRNGETTQRITNTAIESIEELEDYEVTYTDAEQIRAENEGADFAKEFEEMNYEEQERYLTERQEDLDSYWKLVTKNAQKIEEENAVNPQELVHAKVNSQKQGLKDQIESGWSVWRQKMTDAGAAVSDIAKQIDDPYLYAYYNMARASSNAGINMIMKNQTDVTGKTIGKSLNAIWEPVKSKGDNYYNQFQLYLFHMHNIDRMSRFDEKAIEMAEYEFQVVKSYSDELSQYTEREIRAFSRDLDSPLQQSAKEYIHALDNMEMTRKILNKPVFDYDVSAEKSRETAENLLREHPEFKELAEEVYQYNRNLMKYRVDSGLISEEFAEKLQTIYPHYVPTARATVKETAGRREEKRVQAGKTVKRAVGGTGDLIPLHKQMADQTISVVREGSKNRFGARLLARAEDIRKIRDARKAADGMSELQYDRHIDEADPFELGNKTNIFAVWKNGELWEMEVTDDLYTAVKALSPDRETTNVVFKVGRWNVNTYKKLITAYNPFFTIRNFTKDFEDSLFYTKDLKEFLRAYPSAWKEIIKNGELWQQYQALGGTYFSLFDYNNGAETEPSKLYKNTIGRIPGIRDMKIGRRIEALNMFVEQLPRFTEFMATVRKGDGSIDNLMEAMHNAADITTNFGRAGTLGKTLNEYFIPFFNPAVQGLSKAVRTVTETKGFRPWLHLILKAAAFGFAPALLNGLLYHDDEEWKQIRQRDKDVNFLFKIKNGLWLKIPKGRTLSVLGMPVERIKDQVTEGEADWAGFISTAAGQLAPENPFTSNILAPALIEARIFDKEDPGRTWYGAQLESERLQNYAPGERYDTKTDVVSKWIGKITGLSPKKINYLLDSYTGVFGDILLPMLSPAAERNFLSAQFTIDTDYSNRLSNDFYSKLDELAYKKNSATATAEDYVKYKWWNKNASALSEINKAIRKIEEDETLSGKEKRELVKAQYRIKNELILSFEQQYDEYEKAVAEIAQAQINLYGDEAIEYIYREANREVFGAEYALKAYNKSTYDRAVKEMKERGTDFDTFYDFYFEQDADEEKGFELIAKGMETASALKIAKAIGTLKPEAGETNVSQIQKYKAIASINITEQEKKEAISTIASDTDQRRLDIADGYDVTLDQFIQVKENISALNEETTGKKGVSNAKVEAAINKTNNLNARQKAALWQLFTGSTSAKNNPYSMKTGQEVLNAIKKYNLK